MSMELVYTSAPRGLKPNTSGFCTVAMTAGMPRQAMTRLESLSGYEFHFNLSDPNSRLNPTNYAHTRIPIGGQTQSVLSRVAFAGADYSGRTNKIAHHFVLGDEELPPGGPAWTMGEMADGVFRPEWPEAPQELPPRRLDELLGARRSSGPRPARRWEQVAGDAGWAGALAEAFRARKDALVFVIYKPGTDLLPLFEESLAVLPPAERWSVCFATYFTTAQSDCHYHWRGVLAGSSAARTASRFPNALLVDLTAPLPRAADTPYTEAARAGRVVEGPAEAGAAVSAPRRGGSRTAPTSMAPASAREGTSPAPALGEPAGASSAPFSRRLAAGLGIGRRGAAAAGPWHRSPILTLALAAAVCLLALTNAITLMGFLRRGKKLDEARLDLAAAHSSTGSKRELDELKSAMAQMEEASKEKLRRAEERQKELEAKLQESEGDSKGAREARKKAEEKIAWFRSKYYSTGDHEWHPDDKPTETPTVKVEPVKPPEPPPPGGMKLLPLLSPERAQGFKKVSVGPGDNPKPELSKACFPPARCDGLLEPPKLLESVLSFRPDGKDVIVQHKMLRGVGEAAILRCSVDPKEPLLLLEAMGKEAVGDYAPYIQHLVLETASLRDRVVHQYHRMGEPEKRQLTVGYNRTVPPRGGDQLLPYPWPLALRLKCRGLNDGQPFPLLSGSGLGEFEQSKFKSPDAETKARSEGGQKWRELTLKNRHKAAPGLTLDCLLHFSLVKGESPTGPPTAESIKVAYSVPSFNAYFDGLLEPGPGKPWGEFRKHWDELQDQRNALLKEKERLEGERNGLRGEQQAKEAERGKLAKAPAMVDLDKAREHLDEVKKRMGELDKKLAALKEQADKGVKQADMEKFAREVNETKALKQQGLEKQKEAQAKLDAAEKKAATLSQKIKGISADIANLQRQQEEKDAKIGEIEKQITGKRGKNNEIEDERVVLKRKPAEILPDLGSVEIVDPWDRTVWVLEARLKWTE
jgi:hypothetical protein